MRSCSFCNEYEEFVSKGTTESEAVPRVRFQRVIEKHKGDKTKFKMLPNGNSYPIVYCPICGTKLGTAFKQLLYIKFDSWEVFKEHVTKLDGMEVQK